MSAHPAHGMARVSTASVAVVALLGLAFAGAPASYAADPHLTGSVPTCEQVFARGYLPDGPPPIANGGSGVVTTVSDGAALQAALDDAEPGDVIELASGTYTDLVAEVPEGVQGTAEENIVIRPQVPGGVVLTGASMLVLRGSHITVADLNFEDNDGVGPSDLSFAVAIGVIGSDNRVTGSTFTGNGTPEQAWKRVVAVGGQASRTWVDSNLFVENAANGAGVTVDTDSPEGVDNYFVWNTFDRSHPDVPLYWDTAMSAGEDVAQAAKVTRTRFDYNRVVDYDGTFSLQFKTSGSFMRFNCITGGESLLGVRLGHDNVIEGNVVTGGETGMRGGISIAGDRTVVRDNTIVVEDPPSGGSVPHLSGIYLNPGQVSADGNEQWVARDSIVENNRIAAVAPYAPLFWVPTYLDTTTALPSGNLFRDNCFTWLDDDDSSIGFFATERPADATPEQLVADNTFEDNRWWTINNGAEGWVPDGLIGTNGNIWQDCTEPAQPALRPDRIVGRSSEPLSIDVLENDRFAPTAGPVIASLALRGPAGEPVTELEVGPGRFVVDRESGTLLFERRPGARPGAATVRYLLHDTAGAERSALVVVLPARG